MDTLNLPAQGARGEGEPAPQRPARVYFAAPKMAFASLRYRWLRASAAGHFPGSEIVEARAVFADGAQWRAGWPKLLPSLGALVFITTPSGWIGRGVWAEINEARQQVPVYFLGDDGELRPLDQVEFSEPRADNWTHHVRVALKRAS